MTMTMHLCWMLLALVHMLPALAWLRPSLLTRLYGVDAGSDVFVLLRHRAALFFAVLVLSSWAAFDVRVHPAAVVVVAISMLSFLLLYASSGAPAKLKTIAIVDAVGLLPLSFVAWRTFVS
jgi:hypothetical protein